MNEVFSSIILKTVISLLFWRKNWETAMSDRIAQLFGPRNTDPWCRNFKLFTAKVYNPKQNFIHLKRLNILEKVETERLINWNSRISELKMLLKVTHNWIWPKYPISQNIWDILSGVRSLWFGLKKVPIQLSHILLPKLIWQAF